MVVKMIGVNGRGGGLYYFWTNSERLQTHTLLEVAEELLTGGEGGKGGRVYFFYYIKYIYEIYVIKKISINFIKRYQQEIITLNLKPSSSSSSGMMR